MIDNDPNTDSFLVNVLIKNIVTKHRLKTNSDLDLTKNQQSLFAIDIYVDQLKEELQYKTEDLRILKEELKQLKEKDERKETSR